MTKIIGFSGRKRAGKDTAGHFVCGMKLLELEIEGSESQRYPLVDYFKINSDGNLVVPTHVKDLSGNWSVKEGIFDLMGIYKPESIDFLKENIWPTIKPYSFALPIKRDICMNIFGLNREQCFGNDKETDTKCVDKNGNKMLSRDVMKFVGKSFREIYPDVWIDATMSAIKRDNPEFAVITDVRFPNEVEAIKKAGGEVIRFRRNEDDKDNDISEHSLDKDKFDWKNFYKVIDNRKLSIKECNKLVYEVLLSLGWENGDIKEAEESYTK